MSTNNQLYGFFSVNQKGQYGSALYSKPDGSQVEATEVAYDPSPNTVIWRDMVALGEVDYFICTLSLGMYSMPPVKNMPIAGTVFPLPGFVDTIYKEMEIGFMSGKKAKPIETNAPDWKRWRNDQPGYCPCGIARQDCDYHR